MKTNTISFSELTNDEYTRLDVNYHLNIKPQVEEFFIKHRIHPTKGYIEDRSCPLRKHEVRKFTKEISQDQIMTIFALIQYFNRYKKLVKKINESEKGLKIDLYKS